RDGRPPGRHAQGAAPAQGAGRPDRHRRLRHGILVAVVPAAISHRHRQGGSLVRMGRGHQPGRLGDHAGDHRRRPSARPARHRGRQRGPRAAPSLARHGLRCRAGLPLLRSGAAGRAAGPSGPDRRAMGPGVPGVTSGTRAGRIGGAARRVPYCPRTPPVAHGRSMTNKEFLAQYRAAAWPTRDEAEQFAVSAGELTALDVARLLELTTTRTGTPEAHRLRCFAFHQLAKPVREKALFATYVKALRPADPALRAVLAQLLPTVNSVPEHPVLAALLRSSDAALRKDV